MVFPIAGGTQDTGAYEISNSLRFNEADNSKLVFDPDGAEDTQTMTLSFWMKVAVTDFGGDHDNIFSVRPGGGSYTMLVLRTTGRLMFEDSSHGGNLLRTNRLFRDPSAWYHIVLAIDSTQGTAANRIKLYVNGVEETSFETDNRSNLTQNGNLYWGGGHPHQVVGDPTGNYHYGGYLAEMHFVPGSQLTPSSFGETNDNGVWIPKKYTGSHGDGTGGFYLEFKQTGTSANASGIGADTSGGTNHFTPTNLAATDVTVDTPTNNFCTLNPLINSNGTYTLSEGNTKFIGDGSNGWNTTTATMGFSKGKWYWEQKFTQITGGASFAGLVKDDVDHSDNDISGQDDNEGVLYYANAGKYMFGNGGTYESDGEAFGDSFDDGDIISVAADLDNNKMYFAKNGTYQGSGNPSTGSNGLPISEGSYGLVAGSFTFVFPYAGAFYANDGCEFNFGNPSFAISSGNSDANGYGNFEYAVPTGFYALCTKNLAEYG